MSDSVDQLLNAARQHHIAGRLGEVEGLLRRAAGELATAPVGDLADQHAALGDAFLQTGLAQDAIDSYEKSLALRPNHGAVLSNLGAALIEIGRHEQAAAALHQAIQHLPQPAPAWCNLSVALRALNKVDEAIDACRKAVQHDPRHYRSYSNLGYLLSQRGQYRQAADAFARALAIAPRYADALHGIAFVLERLGQRDRAVSAYEQALALKDDPAWRFELQAIKGGAPPPAADPAYVRTLFDQAAAEFEMTLSVGLGYRMPQLLLSAVTAARPHAAALDVLDLGCGTGLAGAAFRPLARHLRGVDLSPKMIDQARKRGIYDELAIADLLTELNEHHARFDLIVAADVFAYLGDLAPIFSATARALRPGGLFAFSTERLDPADRTSDYILRPETRRYAHSQAYLRSTARRAGLDELSITSAPFRTENHADVLGWVVLLTCSATPGTTTPPG